METCTTLIYFIDGYTSKAVRALDEVQLEALFTGISNFDLCAITITGEMCEREISTHEFVP